MSKQVKLWNKSARSFLVDSGKKDEAGNAITAEFKKDTTRAFPAEAGLKLAKAYPGEIIDLDTIGESADAAPGVVNEEDAAAKDFEESTKDETADGWNAKTVPELKAELTERNIEFPSNALKPALVELLELDDQTK